MRDTKREGLWEYYHYDAGVIIHRDEEDRTVPCKVFDLNEMPYSGEFTIDDIRDGGTARITYKAKKGLMNGRAKILDPTTGKTISTEKYEDGVRVK